MHNIVNGTIEKKYIMYVNILSAAFSNTRINFKVSAIITTIKHNNPIINKQSFSVYVIGYIICLKKNKIKMEIENYKLLFLIGFIVFMFGIFNYKKILYTSTHPNGFKADEINSLKKFVVIQNIFTKVIDDIGNKILKRTIIIEKELHDNYYYNWINFVDKLKIHAYNIIIIGEKHREIEENHKVLFANIVSLFKKDNKINNKIYHGRIKTGLASFEKEISNILNLWTGLRDLYIRNKHNNTMLLEKTRTHIEEHKLKIQESNDQKLIGSYFILSTLVGLPATYIFGPFTGTAITALGNLTKVFYDLYNTFYLKDVELSKNNRMIGKYNDIEHILEDLETFISFNTYSISRLIADIKVVRVKIDYFSGDEIKDIFIEKFMESINNLKEYNENIYKNKVLKSR